MSPTPLPDAHRSNIAVSGNYAMDAPDIDLEPLDSTMGDEDDQAVYLSELLATSSTGKEDVFLSGRGNIQRSQPDDGTAQKSGTSAATDFTKTRNNWTQRILEQIRDMLLVLSADGRILYASSATRSVTQYHPDQLNGAFLSHFIHEDDKTTFIREFHESIATGHRLRFHYRFRKSDDSFVILEASGHPHMARENATTSSKQPTSCNGFFLICRPYPTRSCQLLDSFLEHKVENMRLTRRIADLKKEEEEELQAQQQWLHQSDSIGNISPRGEREGFHGVSTSSTDNRPMMLPLAKPGTSSSGQGVFLPPLSDDYLDTLVREDASSTIDGIEMLTGLRYSEGERSQGLSTGDANAVLVQDDADMHIRRGSNDDNDKKNKKLKTSEEYVCIDCGTLASPEWRKGPSGPKTLCNACGCMWYPSSSLQVVFFFLPSAIQNLESLLTTCVLV
jgi:PAS domain S-box-containing protein